MRNSENQEILGVNAAGIRAPGARFSGKQEGITLAVIRNMQGVSVAVKYVSSDASKGGVP